MGYSRNYGHPLPPQRRQTYFKLKIWEFPGSNFDLKKMEILKIVLKNGNSQFFMSKIVKKMGIPIFVLKMLNILGIPMSSSPLQPKSA